MPKYFGKVLLFSSCTFVCWGYSPSEGTRQHHGVASYQSSKPPPSKQQYLIGRPGDWRDCLAKKGFTITTDYLQYVLGNPIGQQRGVVHTEQFAADFNWDLGKATSAKGLEVHLGLVLVSGKNLESKTGSTFPLTLLYGGRTFLVNNIYIKQTAFNGELVFKVGRIEAGDDFLSSPLHLKFLSLAFDSQIALYANTPASGYPYATWGAFCSVAPSPRTRLNTGIYSADESAYKNKYHGVDLSFDTKSGAELIIELTYLLNQLPHEKGLPGTYKTGTFYFTGSKNHFVGGDKTGNYGTYITADQKIYQPESLVRSNRGLSGFLTLLFFPKDRNTFPFYTTGGLVYEGLFSSRPKDTTAFAVARGSYSSVLRQLQRNAQDVVGTYGNIPQNFEVLFELNHWFQIKPWFNCTPAIQYVLNPSGKGGKNALILAVQSNLYF